MMIDRILLAILYLSGWKISTCLRQYHYVANPMKWTEAQTFCRQIYEDLATIENQDEMNQFINTVSSSGCNSEVWIGLYSNIDWRWSDNYEGSGAEYRNWKTNSEPDSHSAQQLCVSIGSDGLWQSDKCSTEYIFFCYEETPQNPSLIIEHNKMNWSSAQRHCRNTRIDLATVSNGSVNKKIQTSVTDKDRAWIGLSRKPHIYWSNSSGFLLSYWNNKSHVIGSATEVCRAAALQSSGKWSSLTCEDKFPFVCYGLTPAPVMRQVVKLRMKPGDSSVDLNDPDVKADLLEKLQDRLKEEGVTGVSLKWREQPDGKVFHKEGKPQRKKRKLRSKIEL